MSVDPHFFSYLLAILLYLLALYPRPKILCQPFTPIPTRFCIKHKLRFGIGASRAGVLKVIIFKFHF